MDRDDISILIFVIGIVTFFTLLVTGVIPKAECEGLRGGEWIDKYWPSGVWAGGHCEAEVIVEEKNIEK